MIVKIPLIHSSVIQYLITEDHRRTVISLQSLWGFGDEMVVNYSPFRLKDHRFASQLDLLNVTRTCSSPRVKRDKSTLCRKSWVFSGYSDFLPHPTGKVDRISYVIIA